MESKETIPDGARLPVAGAASLLLRPTTKPPHPSDARPHARSRVGLPHCIPSSQEDQPPREAARHDSLGRGRRGQRGDDAGADIGLESNRLGTTVGIVPVFFFSFTSRVLSWLFCGDCVVAGSRSGVTVHVRRQYANSRRLPFPRVQINRRFLS